MIPHNLFPPTSMLDNHVACYRGRMPGIAKAPEQCCSIRTWLCLQSEICVAQGKAQVDEEMRRLAGELETARAEAKQHAGKAAAAEQASSQLDEQLAKLKQEREAEMQQLQAEASATGSRLTAAEASLAEAQQQAVALQNAAAKHEGASQQSVERLAALQVRAPHTAVETYC